MRKTQSEGKTVGILIGLRNSQSVRNLFARLRISQCICEIGKAVANLAMRNFAKLLKVFVRQMNSACGLRIWQSGLRSWQSGLRSWQWLPTDCQQIANFARLPTGCQLVANWLPKFLLCCFSKYAPKFAQNY